MARESIEEFNWRDALAKIVAPETLNDIDQFLRPTFPSVRQATPKTDENIPHVNPKYRFQRRIAVDGFGRWREIKPEANAKIFHSDRRESFPSILTKPKVQQKRHSLQSQTERSKSICSAQNAYEHLSTSLRSNIFPGIGKEDWKSTNSINFHEKTVTPPWKRNEFHGLQTDYFGKWSAANANYKQVEKKWNEYLGTVPKFQANWSVPDASKVQPKKPDKETKPKRKMAKQKPKKEPPVKIETPIFDETEPPPLPPLDIPDDNDENFWDFYEKPFNKP